MNNRYKLIINTYGNNNKEILLQENREDTTVGEIFLIDEWHREDAKYFFIDQDNLDKLKNETT